jgi:16S rRNA (guanine966-N2)-methyltransferase
MRIVAGRLRGKALIAPQDRSIRPTSDRVREALFNILEHGDPPVRGARFLDLFAGSGAVGIEAFSRGAAEVWLVDRDLGLAARNRRALGDPPAIRLERRDATRLGAPPEQPFDLAFLDPPYEGGLVPPALAALGRGWLAQGARIVAELGAKEPLDLPPGLANEQERRYGAARLVFLHTT